MSSEIMAAYWQAPPMARTLATAILVTSIMAYFGPLPISWIYFDESRLFKLPPELWRLVTSFLLSSPQLGIVLDPYFGKQPLLEENFVVNKDANQDRSLSVLEPT
uniref:Uncharacterized protein B9K17.160 n=1 Tax=Neurospora crassa TaxID=5141 RepID=Q871X6_NEUCS|nr:putative protein [Neurospora crassa]